MKSPATRQNFLGVACSLALAITSGCGGGSHGFQDSGVDTKKDAVATDTMAGTGGHSIGTGGSMGVGGAIGVGGSTGAGGGNVGVGGADAGTVDAPSGTGGMAGGLGGADGGSLGTGGVVGTGGSLDAGGVVGTGGSQDAGSVIGTGGSQDAGGVIGTGGSQDAGGVAGTGGSGDAGTTNVAGAAILSAPITGPSQSSIFQFDLGQNVDLSAQGTTVNFRMCIAAATTSNTYIQLIAQNGSDNGFNSNFQFTSLAGISTCPTLQDVPLTVAGGSLVPSAVRTIGIQIASDSSAPGPWANPTVLEIDSITATNNLIGPFDFTFNSQPFSINGGSLAGSTIGFSGPGTGTGGAPGTVALSAPITAASQSSIYQFDLGQDVDLSAQGTIVNFRMCVAAANTANTYVQLIAQNGSDNGFGSNFQYTSLVGIATCPTLQDVPMTVAGGSLVASAVRVIGMQIGSSDGSGPWTNPTIMEIDSITATNNLIGPLDFAFNSQPFSINTGGSLTGSTITWQAAP